jgi:hypothetical protein
MPEFQRIQLWRLPLSFFDASLDDAARFKLLAAVTVKAEKLSTPRPPPPMPWHHQAAALLLCSLIALPLVLLGAVCALPVVGWHRSAVGVVLLTLMLALHPLPWGKLAYRRNAAGLLIARYFGLEVVIDRRAGEPERIFGTPVTLDPSHADGATARQTAVVNLACPHGVINFGACVFACLSRWLTGSDQLTSVADATGRTPGVRHFLAMTWPISAARAAVHEHLSGGHTIGLVPDGINGIFAASLEGKGGPPAWGDDRLVLGRKRGLMRLVLQTGATVMPGYFVGTLQLFTICHDRHGLLKALSRRLRLSLFLFYGRWGLPLPRRGPLTAVVCFVPAPRDAPVAEPTDAQLDSHHERVYGGIAAAYTAARPFVGLPETAQLRIL